MENIHSTFMTLFDDWHTWHIALQDAPKQI